MRRSQVGLKGHFGFGLGALVVMEARVVSHRLWSLFLEFGDWGTDAGTDSRLAA